MHYHVGRNLFVINVNIRKQYIIPKFGPMMDITHLQVTVLSTYCMAGKHAVIACHLIVIAAPHMPAPSKICIILHSTAHQFQDFSGGSKMNKFCGHQPQEFHAERPQRFPYFLPRRHKFRTKRPFRIFSVKIIKRRICRKRI